MIPRARVRFRPLGVVGMVGTWNYPLFLNAPAIAQAIAAGNAVVWKPSEMAALVGRQLQESLGPGRVSRGPGCHRPKAEPRSAAPWSALASTRACSPVAATTAIAS